MTRAREFIFELIPPDQGRDVFELETRGDRVVVRGNTPLSAAFGLNWYLKYYCHCSVTLNGNQLSLPEPLPALTGQVRLVAWARYRYINNYCTFGYSAPWWDWRQWETFIDWMALNGINQPLAVTGQEAVWQAVGRRFGMTEAEIGAFLSGPPYLPFSWLGGLDGFGGPLPEEWIAQHVTLERRILARERELGMTPVLQGFTGHIPDALMQKLPGTKAQRIDWVEFHTWILDPLDPLFQKLASAFIEEQTRLFGTDHLYDADPFIEMIPPRGDPKYLADTGRAIYEGMAKGDPQAIWLLESWPFFYKASFWRQDRIKALLDAVPDAHMLVLDLYCESNPLWNRTQGFYGKPWVWSFVYNFGDRTMLAAPLERFGDLAGVRRDPMGRNVRGVGMMMEGYGHDPLVFDLMYELAWRDGAELKPWMREYALFRYGKASAEAQAAWETLRSAVYNHPPDKYGRTIITDFPAEDCEYARYPAEALARTWHLLLRAENTLGATETFRHDLVNVARQALATHADRLYERTMAAYRAKDAAAYRRSSGEFMQLISDLDELLATNDGFLLGSWLEDAKRWGATDAERARLEWNARRILTLWGPGTALRDYAHKEWSGLLTGFYAKRWAIFFRRQGEALETGKPFNQSACRDEMLKFENDWARGRETYPTNPRGESIAVAQRLFEKYLGDSAPASP